LGSALAGTFGEVNTTACPFCGAGCSVALVDGEAFPLRGDPIARGALCQRGWSAGELLFSPLRLVGARLRERGGTATAVSADVALERSAARLAEIRGRHGGASIGILASARLTLEELRLLGDLGRVIGTPHIDSLQRLGCVPEPSRGLDAIEGASRLMVVATDLAVRHPQAYRRVLEALERDVPVRWVGSQETALGALATERIRCLPGREAETAARAVRDDELVLCSSEPALHGQGGPALRRFGGPGVVRLGDYVNQRALLAAGAFPAADGWSAYEMLLRAAAGELKALVIFADDPFEFFPELAARAFAAVEFVLVADAVATRTTEAADAILPGALLAEKSGTIIAADDAPRKLAAAYALPSGLSEGECARRLLTLLGGEAGGARTPAFVRGPDGPRAWADLHAFPFSQ
jgi:anaerobic selenocysteine-containing dehydrogenase